MKTNPKKLILIWLIPALIMLIIVGCLVVYVDPYFHYHKPHTDKFFYKLDNQRSQNDGIVSHFDYDALITGTSMTENFKNTEMDAIFGTNSIKVSYQGGTYREVNACIEKALRSNPNLKTVIRGLDRSYFFDDSTRMRTDLGEFPDYLYDNNPFNDLKYIYNKDVLFGRILPMLADRKNPDFAPGITTFDEYSNWQYEAYVFGNGSVCSEIVFDGSVGEPVHLSDFDRSNIIDNITINVTNLADAYPDVDFYYFITPFSGAWWSEHVRDGSFYREMEAEELIISLIVEHPNIHLYSFNTRDDIVLDLNNYMDTSHYGQWINSLMLKWMHDGEYLLTKDNYKDYLAKEYSIYENFDYTSFLSQIDYTSDFYAAALLNEELTGATPVNVLESPELQISSAEIMTIDNGEAVDTVLECRGVLNREPDDYSSYPDYLLNTEYVGGKIDIAAADDYGYVTFYGRKSYGQGQPIVYVYNDQGERVREVSENSGDLDEEWHQFVIDITELKGNITIIFNGGGANNAQDPESAYEYKDVMIY